MHVSTYIYIQKYIYCKPGLDIQRLTTCKPTDPMLILNIVTWLISN